MISSNIQHYTCIIWSINGNPIDASHASLTENSRVKIHLNYTTLEKGGVPEQPCPDLNSRGPGKYSITQYAVSKYAKLQLRLSRAPYV